MLSAQSSGRGRNRRGAIFFNWGLVFIAFFTLSAAFITLVVKEHRMSETNPTIGEKQFVLYHRYQDGEMMKESLDLAAERSAERSAYLLALQGGYVPETLDRSECVPKVSGNGTPIWVNGDKECFPDYFYDYMTLFDQSLADYFGSDAFSYDKPHYAHFFGDGVLEGGSDVELISRALDHVAINLTDPTDVFLTEGFFTPLEEEVFVDHIHELSHGGVPAESYFIDVIDPTATLAEIGEWVPTVAGAYSGLCTYCGKNKELFNDYHPEDFAEAECSLGTSSEPRCCQGKCPPDALVLQVPYYAQCSFPNRGSAYKPCYAGCGPTSVKMAFEAAGLGVLDLYNVWGTLGTSASAGTDRARIKSYAQSQGIFVADGADLGWDAIQEHILQGHPIIFNPTQQYNDERYCYGLGDCPEGPDHGHYFVVVGISPETLIINEPYPWWSPVSFSSGNNLVLRKETVQKLYAVSGRVYYIIINPKVDLRPEIAEPEEGLPEDVTPLAGVSET